jgi:hypothetical protein
VYTVIQSPAPAARQCMNEPESSGDSSTPAPWSATEAVPEQS